MTENLHPWYISNVAAKTYIIFKHIYSTQCYQCVCVCKGPYTEAWVGHLSEVISLRKTDSSSISHQFPGAVNLWVKLCDPLLHESWNFAWILTFCIMYSLVPYPLIMKSLLTIFITLSIELFYLENAIAFYSLQIAK